MTKKITKKVTQKKVTKKTRALAVKKNVAPLEWGSVVSKDSQALQTMCKQVAEIYGVPPLGVNSMAGQPYLNKEGRLFLLTDIKKGNQRLKAIRTEFLQMSTAPDVAAICKKTLVFKDGLEIEGIGEASKENVKLAAVQKTLNMMAETRALNRAIWQAIGGQIWERVAKNLAKKGIVDEASEQKIHKAGSVSYEEVATDDTPKAKEMTTAEKFQKAKGMIANIKTKQVVKGVMLQVQNSEIYSKEQRDRLMEELVIKDNDLENGK